MSETLIKKYSTSVIKDFIDRANDLKGLTRDLNLPIGELKELFVSRVLRSFLTAQFDIGSGIVVNSADKKSSQIDILIYDNRILPPFIKEQSIGVYPAESIIATIEIKTNLEEKGLANAENTAQKLCDEVFDLEYGFKPLCAVFGFEGSIENLSAKEKGIDWLRENAQHLFNICIAGKYSWANVGGKGWWPEFYDRDKPYNETKRFIALLVDNIRTASQERFQAFINPQTHQDWLSAYIRN